MASASTDRLLVHPERNVRFHGSFNVRSTSSFSMTNQTKKRFCFKVKTNAPKGRISVAPVSGIVEPGQRVVTRVTVAPVSTCRDLQPLNYGLLVESAIVDPGSVDFHAVWSSQKGKTISDRLTCVFESGHKSLRFRTCSGKVQSEVSRLNDAMIESSEDDLEGEPRQPSCPTTISRPRFQSVIRSPKPVVFTQNLDELQFASSKGKVVTWFSNPQRCDKTPQWLVRNVQVRSDLPTVVATWNDGAESGDNASSGRGGGGDGNGGAAKADVGWGDGNGGQVDKGRCGQDVAPANGQADNWEGGAGDGGPDQNVVGPNEQDDDGRGDAPNTGQTDEWSNDTAVQPVAVGWENNGGNVGQPWEGSNTAMAMKQLPWNRTNQRQPRSDDDESGSCDLPLKVVKFLVVATLGAFLFGLLLGKAGF